MNLFEISQNFVSNGPTWLSQDTRPQSARTTGVKKDKISSLSLLNQERKETEMKMKSE